MTHDWALAIDQPADLLELLFVRDAWGLDVEPTVPPCSPLPAVGASARPSLPGLEDEWGALWAAALWAEAPGTHRWVTSHGPAGIDRRALIDWVAATRTSFTFALLRATSPNTSAAIAGLLEARGMSKIIVLPVEDPWTEQGDHAVAVSPGLVLTEGALARYLGGR